MGTKFIKFLSILNYTMKKTFEEIIKERYPHRQNNLHALDYEVTALMQYVREQTLKECAEKVKIDKKEFIPIFIVVDCEESPKDCIYSLNENMEEAMLSKEGLRNMRASGSTVKIIEEYLKLSTKLDKDLILSLDKNTIEI